jgi:hypothetical protein
VAGAVRLWAPLRPDAHISDARRGRVLERLRLFVDAYDPPDLSAEKLVEAVSLHHSRLYRLIEDEARDGNAGFIDYWRESERRAVATAAWYDAAHSELVRALTKP